MRRGRGKGLQDGDELNRHFTAPQYSIRAKAEAACPNTMSGSAGRRHRAGELAAQGAATHSGGELDTVARRNPPATPQKSSKRKRPSLPPTPLKKVCAGAGAAADVHSYCDRFFPSGNGQRGEAAVVAAIRSVASGEVRPPYMRMATTHPPTHTHTHTSTSGLTPILTAIRCGIHSAIACVVQFVLVALFHALHPPRNRLKQALLHWWFPSSLVVWGTNTFSLPGRRRAGVLCRAALLHQGVRRAAHVPGHARGQRGTAGPGRSPSPAAVVQGLRHHFGPCLTDFPALHHSSRAVRRALLGDHVWNADWCLRSDGMTNSRL